MRFQYLNRFKKDRRAYIESTLIYLPIYLILIYSYLAKYDYTILYVIPLIIFLHISSYVEGFCRYSILLSNGVVSYVIASRYCICPAYISIIVSSYITLVSLEYLSKDIKPINAFKGRIGRIGSTGVIYLTVSLFTLLLSVLDNNIIYLAAVYMGYSVFKIAFRFNKLSSVSVKYPKNIRVFRGDEARYKIIVENRGGIGVSIGFKKVDTLGYRIYIYPKTVELDPSTSKDIELIVIGRLIGSFKADLNIYIHDVNGFAVLEESLEMDIVIKPILEKARRAAYRIIEIVASEAGLRGESLLEIPRQYRPASVGLYRGSRDYRAGDDPKTIHFKKSLEKHKLIVREFEDISTDIAIVLSDVSCNNSEDLDEVLYNTVLIVIDLILQGRPEASLVLYNDRDVILTIPPTNPLYILNKLLNSLDSIKPTNRIYRYLLDEEPHPVNVSSENQLIELQLKYQTYVFKSSILYKITSTVLNLYGIGADIFIVRSGSIFKPIYPIVKEFLKEVGINTRDVTREYIERIEEVVSSHMKKSL